MNKVVTDLLSRKSFIFSVVVIAFFVILALAAPILTSYNNPYSISQQFVAAPYAVPSWATLFPQYRSLPPNVHLTLTGSGGNEVNSTYIRVVVPPGGTENVSFPIKWNWSHPYNVIISFNLLAPDTTGFNVNLYLNNLNIMTLSPIPITPTVQVKPGTVNHVMFNSESINPSNSPYVNSLPFQDQPLASYEFPSAALPKPGLYYLVVSFQNTGNSKETFLISNPQFSSLGFAYGRLGTDDNGGSVFSEFIYGARFDLYLSLVASALIIGIGLIIGLLAGYIGGFTDLTLNALTDFFLLIPGLPLLIVLISIFDATGVIVNVNKALIILLIISFLSWPGTAKIIRGQTLSLRNRTFVEASRALGEGKFRILFRHIVPNLMGILFAQLAYDVPGVILAESGLDFLGLGIINFPTWGNMLGFATNNISFVNGFAWWWVLPPGIGIILLSTAFYYFGTAMLDVLSPYKLRGE
ncbi:ABC transporter permease [Metallosphaera tengchongensis]|uniref:ABC transporter permease n=1 Tax=Metallosphaera tengchongensis TaxID=1532350 RepID=A0A6N0NYG3_9CREN|nr:ABC transporter permease [Metallosphaera tengchongensis]QKR00140.1 ABC transporter permease [Metallosphaera tengchongensis]